MTANVSVGKYLYHLLTDERMEETKKKLLDGCPKSKIILLWQILFETEIRDRELLKERVYLFGSLVKEDDHWGRDVFLCLVVFLNLVIK